MGCWRSEDVDVDVSEQVGREAEDSFAHHTDARSTCDCMHQNYTRVHIGSLRARDAHMYKNELKHTCTSDL